jgi:RelA/SpoT family (p)ppGpp synthetase
MLGFHNNKNAKSDESPSILLGLNPEKDLDFLLKECKIYLKVYNEQKVRRAFMLCLDAHANKLRKSGAAYYTHPLEVARIVMREIPLDDVSVISALLHDVLDEGDHFTLKDIRAEFGNDIADIVEGIHKIEHIENRNATIADQAENYRKLLLSLFKDIRIILIKLADRLHNMRTLEFLTEPSRLKLSKETLDIFAPFANRFGLRNIKWELEDLSFKHLNKESYYEIKSALKFTREEREKYVTDIITPIEERLHNDEVLKKLKIKFEINGRAKHIYSIHNKMIARNKPMDELYDLFAIRILLDTEIDNLSFYVYGVVAGIFQPVPETFKDYINTPKKNGYQSIHCAIVGHDKRIVELQIRTVKMHELAEKGFAAHFRYKGGRIDQQSILEKQQILDWIGEVREIFDHAKSGTNEELVENFHNNLFFDEIYVYTPKNEFRTLPKDSTPLDFAYDIHSEVGNHFIGAKVHGRLVTIDYKLQSGDQIEILTSKKQMPSPEWIKYAHTARAKQYIQKYLKDKDKQLEDEGRSIWNEKCKENKIRLSDSEFETLIKSVRYDSPEAFFISLAKEHFSLDKAFEFIKLKLKTGIRNDIEPKEREMNIRKNNEISKSVNNNGNKKIINGLYGELIVLEDGSVDLKMVITALNKPSIIEQINTAVLSMSDTEILEINIEEVESKFIETLTLNFKQISYIEMMIDNLKKIDGVKEIEILKI